MKLLRQCKTCEFNFDGICAGHGDTYAYGGKISDDSKTCNDWGASLDYFTEITESAPWYIREPYKSCRISYDEFLQHIELDENRQPIKVNLYDAIMKIYDKGLEDLASILGVTINVIARARSRGTPEKRILNFSQALCIPPNFFRKFTNLDIDKLWECKNDFYI